MNLVASNIAELPADERIHMITRMDIDDIHKLSLTNRYWNELCHSETIWLILVKRDFDLASNLKFNTWYQSYRFSRKIMQLSYQLINDYSIYPNPKYRNDKSMAKDIFSILIVMTHRVFTHSSKEQVNLDVIEDFNCICKNIEMIMSGLNEGYTISVPIIITIRTQDDITKLNKSRYMLEYISKYVSKLIVDEQNN